MKWDFRMRRLRFGTQALSKVGEWDMFKIEGLSRLRNDSGKGSGKDSGSFSVAWPLLVWVCRRQTGDNCWQEGPQITFFVHLVFIWIPCWMSLKEIIREPKPSQTCTFFFLASCQVSLCIQLYTFMYTLYHIFTYHCIISLYHYIFYIYIYIYQ